MSLKTIHIAALSVITISDFWRVYTGTHALLKSNPEYDQKRHELFEHYYPIEICPTLPANEKAKYMEEWYVMQTHCNSTGPVMCDTNAHCTTLYLYRLICIVHLLRCKYFSYHEVLCLWSDLNLEAMVVNLLVV